MTTRNFTKEGYLPNILVILSTNLSSTFMKFSYLASNDTIDTNEINYTKFTMIQTSQVKLKGNI